MIAFFVYIFVYVFCFALSLASIAGIVFLVLYLLKKNNENFTKEVYIDMWLHVLLLLVTCGIWTYVWIYKTTAYLNGIPGEEDRNPLYQFLLCMCVPFYLIYWVYVTAQKIDKKATSVGLESNITTISLILAIFIPIVAYIIMQDKLNNISNTLKMDVI